MTEKEKIRNIIELFIAWNGETEAIDVANIDSAVDFIVDSLQEEHISEDLKEAADDALSNVLNTHEIINIRSCLEMFRYGAKWQKEQLMTNAIDMIVGYWMPNGLRLDIDETENLYNIDEGNKVKLIIIKDE